MENHHKETLSFNITVEPPTMTMSEMTTVMKEMLITLKHQDKNIRKLTMVVIELLSLPEPTLKSIKTDTLVEELGTRDDYNPIETFLLHTDLEGATIQTLLREIDAGYEGLAKSKKIKR